MPHHIPGWSLATMSDRQRAKTGVAYSYRLIVDNPAVLPVKVHVLTSGRVRLIKATSRTSWDEGTPFYNLMAAVTAGEAASRLGWSAA